ncbi:DUF6491 family protein [Sphingopyxis sp. XHP0097]|uniref:DUF6491 family protein n=1 Tax=Sphingopyxis jiangsuensis TaxID=2871171 RepID=A0ABS7MFU5_9SPHN|nr:MULTISPECIES: DUF6491 family protein [Sphingopyxis]MBY4637901.1 DUF6491 family protein [Sphingopyxis jiangsuensis]
MNKILALSLAASLLPLSAAAANEPAEAPRALGEEASIVFPSDSTIRNWRADRDRGIWVQDRRGDWFYGTFAGICRDIDFAPQIAVDSRGVNRLDRFATILVRGERCPLVSFVTSAPPPSKEGASKEDKKTADAAEDAVAN